MLTGRKRKRTQAMREQRQMIVHIGTEKTGTTTLQHSLSAEREALVDHRVAYVSTPGRVDARAVAAACLGEPGRDDYLRDQGVATREQLEEFRETVFANLQAELSRALDSCNTVVLSSEHLHSRLRDRAALERLRGCLAPYVDRVHIVCYLRRQVDVATSFYSTELKNGGASSLERTVRRVCRPGNHYYNYRDLLDLWADVFGAEAIDVRRYCAAQRGEGGIVGDFLNYLGVPVDAVACRESNHNESVNHLGQVLLRALNRHCGNVEDDQARESVSATRRRLAQAFAGPAERLPEGVEAEVQAWFDEINEAVHRRWFPSDERLFDAQRAGGDRRMLTGDQEELVETLASLVASDGKIPSTLQQYDAFAPPLRDAARKLERNDLSIARDLMQLAHYIRPQGPAIRRHLARYQRELGLAGEAGGEDGSVAN